MLVRNFLQYFFAILLSLLIFAMITQLWHADLHLPFRYSGDAVLSNTFIKSIIDTGWNLKNPYIGAPSEYNLADFPMAEGFHYILIKIIACFSSNHTVVLNTFFILTFPLCTVTALFALKRCGLNYPFALVGSILFAMAPYHFLRNESHLFLSSYYIIPLTTWLALLVSENKLFIDDRQSSHLFNKPHIRWIMYGLLCILIGTSGIYYALFSIFFIVIAGLLAIFNHKKPQMFVPAAILSFGILSSAVVNLSPSIIYRMEHGYNHVAAVRVNIEAELYGLNIAKMLIPSPTANEYQKVSPLPNGETMSIGSIASIGFLLLLVMLLIPRSQFSNIRIYTLSQLNICAVLLATLGGIGALIAYTVSPMIRAYGRMSIFITFFSLTAFLYIIQQLLKKYSISRHNRFTYIICTILLIAGTYSQTSPSDALPPTQKTIKSTFESDKIFIKKIENILPPNSMIFQLPYVPFPENPPVNNMIDYQHFIAYLHSNKLRWSYGAMKGRETDAWQKEISALPIPEFVKSIKNIGFKGVYIDRRGYKDRGANIEKQLIALFNSKPIVSDDTHLVFYALP